MQHLITGGSGFLGSLIADELLKKGEKVRILDVIDDPDRPKEIEFIHGSVCDEETVKRAMRNVNIVHHNAALVPLTKSGKEFWNVNVLGSECVARAAIKEGADAFIHMSSSSIYGAPKDIITNRTLPNPIEIYGSSKLAAEKKIQSIFANTSIHLNIIRPRCILGKSRLGIFKILFDWINDNKNIYIIGSGNNPLQFVHAKDLMDFYMLTLSNEIDGTFNVGTPYYQPLRLELETLINYANKNSKVISLPPLLAVSSLKILDYAKLSPLSPFHYLTYGKPYHFDTKPLTDLGWNPKYSNQEMIQESYDSFLENKDSLNLNQKSVHRRPVKEKILWLLKKLS